MSVMLTVCSAGADDASMFMSEIGSSEFHLGYSITHPKDNYSKKKGRIISENRAKSFKSEVTTANSFGNLLKEANSYAGRLLDIRTKRNAGATDE